MHNLKPNRFIVTVFLFSAVFLFSVTTFTMPQKITSGIQAVLQAGNGNGNGNGQPTQPPPPPPPTDIPTPTPIPPTPTPTTGIIFSPIDDAFVDGTAITSNFGTDPLIKVRALSPRFQSYLKFDLSPIAGKRISSATLRLGASTSFSQSIIIRGVLNDSWNENSITNNNKPPSDYAIVNFSGGSAGSYRDINITNDVQTKVGTLYSIRLETGTESTQDMFFNSKENAVNKPELGIVYDASSTYTPPPAPTPQVFTPSNCSANANDIMIVLDKSGSMAGNISEAKTYANKFVDLVAQNTQNRIGFVTFDAGSQLVIPLTGNYSQIKNAISSISTTGGSCGTCGIYTASDHIAVAGRVGATKIIVFISDGQLNGGGAGSMSEAQASAYDAATESFNRDGTAFFTVASGGNADDAFMDNVAKKTKGKKYSAPSVPDLQFVFPQIAYDIGIGNGTIAGTVYDDKNRSGTYDAGDLLLEGYSVRIDGISLQNPGVTTTDVDGKYVFGGLCDDTYTISQPYLPPGWLQISPTNNNSHTVQIAGGNQVFDINFFDALGYVVEGYVFSDLNKNRVKDTGEPPYTGPITVSSNATTTVFTTIANGYYKIEGFLPGSYTISYTSPIPSDFFLVYPKNGPPPSYLVSVGPITCSGDAISQSVCTNGNVSNLNFAISDSYPWFQTYNGGIRADNGITDRIPQSPAYPPYISTNDSQSTTPGIVYSGDGTVSTGRGSISTNNRIVGGTQYPEVYSRPVLTSYTNLLQNTKRTGVVPIDMTTLSGCANLGNCTLPANLPSGIYQATGDVTLNGYAFPAGGSFVFLIDGSLTIRGDLTLSSDSTATYATSGDIIVDQNIGAATNTFPMPAPQLMGFFSAGRNFIIQGVNDCIIGADRMLNIHGTVITNAARNGGSLQNNRDLCGDNYVAPSLTITASLNGILNAPTFIMKTNINSMEATP